MSSETKPFSADKARRLVVEKLRDAGSDGVASLVTAKTPAPKRAAIEQALSQLEATREVVVDRRKVKPRFFLREMAPDVPLLDEVCENLVAATAAAHPQLLAAAELKERLRKPERVLLTPAIERLVRDRQLIALRRGTAEVFAHGDSLRAACAIGQPPALEDEAAFSPGPVRRAYRELVQGTGFPAVEIVALQQGAGVIADELKEWLLGEYRAGRALLSLGDWSLADEAARAAAVELGGEKYLRVELRD